MVKSAPQVLTSNFFAGFLGLGPCLEIDSWISERTVPDGGNKDGVVVSEVRQVLHEAVLAPQKQRNATGPWAWYPARQPYKPAPPTSGRRYLPPGINVVGLRLRASTAS